MGHPEGAGLQRAERVDFDPRVRLEFRGTRLSSDGGLLVMRELDDMLGLSDLAAAALHDNRRGKNTVHRLYGLFRQSVFGRLAGYEDVNDADRLALDPVMRQVVGGCAVDAQAASASQMGRFETETLAMPENRAALADLNGQWIDRFHDRNGLKYIILDMDSSVSPTHGDQEGTAWNGHFGCSCYHPNFLFNQFGMLERCALRNGNVHSADGWKEVLDPVIVRYAKRDIMRFFRADAAYAIPSLYERLEEAGYFYAIRMKKNAVLEGCIAPRLTRPVGRPSKTKVKRFYEDFQYQAQSWDKPRRVIAKIEWHPGELFPRLGFIVTNLPMEPEEVTRFYNRRGTAEQHIKEGKYAFHWTRLSCRRFRDNEVRLQLHALTYNLATFLRCIELPEAMAGWSLTSLQLKLIHCLASDACITEKEDRGPRRAPRPRHHLPTRRGCRHRCYGQGHPCRNPPITSASAMRVTATQIQTGRKQQDRSVRRAEKRGRKARMMRIRSLIRTVSAACAAMRASRTAKCLIYAPDQATLTTNGMPLGGCRLKQYQLVHGRTELKPYQFWQTLLAADAELDAPYDECFPARLPDGRVLLLPIRALASTPNAIASLILNQASFAVEAALADALADKLRGTDLDVVVGLPTLGLSLARAVAERLGHARYVPLGTSRKFWYDDALSVPLASITSTGTGKRLYLDARMLPLLTGRRVCLIDDVISSGTSICAARDLLALVGVTPVMIATAMLQTRRWAVPLGGVVPVAALHTPLLTGEPGCWTIAPDDAPA